MATEKRTNTVIAAGGSLGHPASGRNRCSMTLPNWAERGEPWARADLIFLKDSLERGMSLAEIAGFLRRVSESEIDAVTAITAAEPIAMARSRPSGVACAAKGPGGRGQPPGPQGGHGPDRGDHLREPPGHYASSPYVDLTHGQPLDYLATAQPFLPPTRWSILAPAMGACACPN